MKGLFADIWCVTRARQVFKPGQVRIEVQRHGTGWAMALFTDNHISDTNDTVHSFLPLLVFVGVGLGFVSAQIVLLALNEHDHICVLLNRTGFTQVSQLRALVFTVFHLARQL